jgi:transcriptional regulator with XRE-family HTH domain
MLGISKQMLSQYETGKVLPSLKETLRIASVYTMPFYTMPLEIILDYWFNDQLKKAGVTSFKAKLEQAS